MVRTIQGKHPNYYEAILQLRDVQQEVIEQAKQEFKKAKVTVTKTSKLKNGVDMYVSDKDFTRSLGKKLQSKYGGEFLITASLFGRKQGKEIHRITVLFRQAHFKKGDRVEYQGEEYQVKMIGKEIMLHNHAKGKKVHVKYKDMDGIKKLA
jgi:nonsense-mediated mRNA decay protein 3